MLKRVVSLLAGRAYSKIDGCSLLASDPLDVGETLTLVYPRTRHMAAQVRWAKDIPKRGDVLERLSGRLQVRTNKVWETYSSQADVQLKCPEWVESGRSAQSINSLAVTRS